MQLHGNRNDISNKIDDTINSCTTSVWELLFTVSTLLWLHTNRDNMANVLVIVGFSLGNSLMQILLF